MGKKNHEYVGEQISIGYDAKRCIHAAECVHGLPAVFDPDRRPWVEPDEAGADAIAEVVGRCPTGALRFERLDGGPAESAPVESVVKVEADGPLYASGDLRIETGGSEAPVEARIEYRAALCRCGASANKPFCDNAHLECGFSDAGAVDAGRGSGLEADAADDSGVSAPVTIRPAANGPLLFGGAVELRSADGTSRIFVENPALCRCGHSQDKPFCDGAHFSVGFQAD